MTLILTLILIVFSFFFSDLPFHTFEEHESSGAKVTCNEAAVKEGMIAESKGCEYLDTTLKMAQNGCCGTGASVGYSVTATKYKYEMDKSCDGSRGPTKETKKEPEKTTEDTETKFSVAHSITLEGISATEFMADAKIISSFQNTVATTLGVKADKIINIKAKSKRRQLFGRELAAAYQLFGRELAETGCSVDYEVVVEDETAMKKMSATVKEEMSDSSAFTTELVATMKKNEVTSVTPSAIKADTTKEPSNAGSSGEEVEEDEDFMNDDLSAGGFRFAFTTITAVAAAAASFACVL